jgi:hypothetical protein
MEMSQNNTITLFTDNNDNMLSFTDSTGNYPLSNNSTNATRYYIIRLTPELTHLLNQYKVMLGELPKNKRYNDLFNIGYQLAAELRRHM